MSDIDKLVEDLSDEWNKKWNKKIKPCPSCGSKNVAIVVRSRMYSPELNFVFAPPSVLIECKDCYLYSSPYFLPDDDSYKLVFEQQVNRAINDWNRGFFASGRKLRHYE